MGHTGNFCAWLPAHYYVWLREVFVEQRTDPRQHQQKYRHRNDDKNEGSEEDVLVTCKILLVQNALTSTGRQKITVCNKR
jgi:hypothetical protein